MGLDVTVPGGARESRRRAPSLLDQTPSLGERLHHAPGHLWVPFVDKNLTGVVLSRFHAQAQPPYFACPGATIPSRPPRPPARPRHSAPRRRCREAAAAGRGRGRPPRPLPLAPARRGLGAQPYHPTPKSRPPSRPRRLPEHDRRVGQKFLDPALRAAGPAVRGLAKQAARAPRAAVAAVAGVGAKLVSEVHAHRQPDYVKDTDPRVGGAAQLVIHSGGRPAASLHATPELGGSLRSGAAAPRADHAASTPYSRMMSPESPAGLAAATAAPARRRRGTAVGGKGKKSTTSDATVGAAGWGGAGHFRRAAELAEPDHAGASLPHTAGGRVRGGRNARGPDHVGGAAHASRPREGAAARVDRWVARFVESFESMPGGSDVGVTGHAPRLVHSRGSVVATGRGGTSGAGAGCAGCSAPFPHSAAFDAAGDTHGASMGRFLDF